MDNNKSLVIKTLKYTYAIVPIVAGLDKFTNLLTDWSHYLTTDMSSFMPFEAKTFMMIVGVVEIVAGSLVIFRPKIGSLVVMAWLIVISLTLFLSGHYFDVAIRDLVMAVGAFSFYKLSE